MKKTIWKYVLTPTFYPSIEMPEGAIPLFVSTQEKLPGVEEACMWALVDPGAKKEMRLFSIYGTGHDMPVDPGIYIGSFQFQKGVLVFHVFEERKED